jgi:hypothetical protein
MESSVRVCAGQFDLAEYGIVRYALPEGIVGVEFRFDTAGEDRVERWIQLFNSIQNT